MIKVMARDEGGTVPLTKTPDAALLHRSGAGDRDAFEQIYDRHVRAVFWQAHRIVRDADLAQEICQDAFITLWRKSRSVRVVDESVLPWLLVTARYLALNAHRRQRRDLDRTAVLDHDVADPAPNVEEATVAGEVQRRIDTAVQQLSPIDQQLYRLCVDGDHSYESAAQELGVSHGAVRNRLSRLRAQLRSDLRAVRETP